MKSARVGGFKAGVTKLARMTIRVTATMMMVEVANAPRFAF